MVIDTSALVAILADEPEREAFVVAIERDEVRLLSAASFLEAGIVIRTRYGSSGLIDLERLLQVAAVEVLPVDAEQARIALKAFEQYGKGRHPAALNYGDCFAYALAIASSEPLLFKGDDFSRTDVRVAA
jgi:Uncharacterized protein conserved in bacteria